jgi:hypothetical protein
MGLTQSEHPLLDGKEDPERCDRMESAMVRTLES